MSSPRTFDWVIVGGGTAGMHACHGTKTHH